MRAQDEPLAVFAGIEIEGIVLLPGRMLLGDVEFGEVVVVGLDVRPSATENPRSAKISMSSSITCETGWIRPSLSGPSLTGSVMSALSEASRASSAASSNFDLRTSRASVTRDLTWLTDCPKAFRSSGASLPSFDISADSEPFLPSAPIRTSSSAARSAAPSMALRMSASSRESSVVSLISGSSRHYPLRAGELPHVSAPVDPFSRELAAISLFSPLTGSGKSGQPWVTDGTSRSQNRLLRLRRQPLRQHLAPGRRAP